MPTLETPPDPTTPQPPLKVRTGRFGELEQHELIHLLDTLDDERSKARFREAIYISFIFYLAVGWFLLYGPQVLFHQPRLINPERCPEAARQGSDLPGSAAGCGKEAAAQTDQYP